MTSDHPRTLRETVPRLLAFFQGVANCIVCNVDDLDKDGHMDSCAYAAVRDALAAPGPEGPWSLSMKQGGPDQPEDECDIEYRGPLGKFTVGEDVPDEIAEVICSAPVLHAKAAMANELAEELKDAANILSEIAAGDVPGPYNNVFAAVTNHARKAEIKAYAAWTRYEESKKDA